MVVGLEGRVNNTHEAGGEGHVSCDAIQGDVAGCGGNGDVVFVVAVVVPAVDPPEDGLYRRGCNVPCGGGPAGRDVKPEDVAGREGGERGRPGR